MTPEEINIRIAEITGDTDEHDWDFRIGVCTRCGSEEGMEDPPRTPERGCVRDFWGDANDALWAATRVGLWDKGMEPSPKTDGWAIEKWEYGAYMRDAASSNSLPSAICLAILDAKETNLRESADSSAL